MKQGGHAARFCTEREMSDVQQEDGTFVSHGSGTAGYVVAAILGACAAGLLVAAIVCAAMGNARGLIASGFGCGLSILLGALLMGMARTYAHRRLTVDETSQTIVLENFPDPASFWPWGAVPRQVIALSEIEDVWFASTQGTSVLNISVTRDGRPAVHRIGDHMSDFLFLVALLKEIGPRGHQPRARPWLDRPGAAIKLILLMFLLTIVGLIVVVVIGIYIA